MATPATLSPEKKSPAPSRTERRRSSRHDCFLHASWRLLGARDNCFTPATVQDLGRHGVALIVDTLFQQGAILSVQFEGVAEPFAGPWLARVESVRQVEENSWVIGCALSCEFTEGELKGLLQSAGKTRPPRPAADTSASRRPDNSPPKEGVRERRATPRRGGTAVAVLIGRNNGRGTRIQGAVSDRSLGGLALALPCPLPIGSSVSVRALHASDATPWTPVRVKNCRASGRQWIVGCEFTGSLPTSILLSFC